MVVRPIHNLKVAGSNPEGGNIFSERYLARKGSKKREKEMENEMWRNCKGRIRGNANILMFMNF